MGKDLSVECVSNKRSPDPTLYLRRVHPRDEDKLPMGMIQEAKGDNLSRLSVLGYQLNSQR